MTAGKAADLGAERARLIELLFGFFPAQLLHAVTRLGIPGPTGFSVLTARPA